MRKEWRNEWEFKHASLYLYPMLWTWWLNNSLSGRLPGRGLIIPSRSIFSMRPQRVCQHNHPIHTSFIYRAVRLQIDHGTENYVTRPSGQWCVLKRLFHCSDTYEAQNVDFHHFSRKCDRRIDGRTDRRTDRPGYRDARTHLKRKPLNSKARYSVFLYRLLD